MFDLNAQNGNLLAVLCVEVYLICYKITHLIGILVIIYFVYNTYLNIYRIMSGAYTPGTVPTAPYGWNQQTSVSPASPYTPQPECK